MKCLLPASVFFHNKLKIGKFRQKLTDFWQRTVILIEDAPPQRKLHPRRFICTPLNTQRAANIRIDEN